MDHKVVLIRQGRFVLSTHQSRLLRASTDTAALQQTPSADVTNDSAARGAPANHNRGTVTTLPPLDDSDTSDTEEEEEDTTPEDTGDNTPLPIPTPDDTPMTSPHSPHSPRPSFISPSLNQASPASPTAHTSQNVINTSPQLRSTHSTAGQAEKTTQHQDRMRIVKRNGKIVRVCPKAGDTIIYREKAKAGDDTAWVKVEITGKGNKATDKRGPYLNFVRENGEGGGVYIDETEWNYTYDYDSVHGVHYLDTVYNYVEEEQMESDDEEIDTFVVFIPQNQWHKPAVQEAMRKELGNFENFGAYEVVPDKGQGYITSSWVITEKMFGSVKGVKARLVVHGNQEEEHHQSDSPTVTKDSLRLQVALAVQKGWSIKTADVTAAFLQSHQMPRKVYVKPPPGVHQEDTLWLLKKPMYGLDDAGRLWYLSAKSDLEQLGAKTCPADEAMFFFHHEGKLSGIITVHVDDFQYCGSQHFHDTVMKEIFAKYKFGQLQEGDFKVLGWNIRHKGGDIMVGQHDYIEAKISNIDIDTKRPPTTELSAEEKTLFRRQVGKLRWLSDQTRCDISYEELEMSCVQNKATVKDVKAMAKMINHVRNEDLTMRFKRIGGERWFLTVFADASLGGLPDTVSSAFGYIILLSDGYSPGKRGNCCVLSWKANKLPRTVTSTFEAETLALSEALDRAVVIRQQILAMMNMPEELLKIEAFSDCNDCVTAVHSTKQVQRKDRIRLDLHKVKEMIQDKRVESVTWVPTEFQLADIFTKRGVSKAAIQATVGTGRFFY